MQMFAAECGYGICRAPWRKQLPEVRPLYGTMELTL